jgi:uncharacterized coiled-coil protein SlyX
VALSRIGGASALVVATALALPAHGQTVAPPSETRAAPQLLQVQQQMIDEQNRRITELSRMLAEQQRLLQEQQQQIDALQRQSEASRVSLYPAVHGGRYRRDPDTGFYYAQAPVAPQPIPEQPVAPVPPTAPEAAQERPESEKPREQLLLERGGVLLPAGTLQVEPSIDISHISSDRIAISGFTIFDAIVIGTIRVDDLERDIYTGALTFRYGVTDRVQVDLRVPGVYRRDEEVLGVGTANQRDREIDGYGLGDVEASAAWQALSADGWIPNTVLRLRGRFPTGTSPFEIERVSLGVPGGETRLAEAPTGSGFYGVGAGATFVWRADPVVFFAGGSYTANLERSFSEFGTIDPGDTIEWFGGLNVALSEVVALNMSFVNQLTSSTEQNGRTSPGTDANDARLVLGTSIGLGKLFGAQTSLLVSAGMGLTEQSPDYTFTVSLPMSFSLF